MKKPQVFHLNCGAKFKKIKYFQILLTKLDGSLYKL